MADQGRWFKLWCDADDDPDMAIMPIGDYGCWCKLGAYTKAHGTAGILTIRKPADQTIVHPLQSKFQVADFEAVIRTIQRFKNPTVTHETDSPVTYCVRWANWPKYQGDFSSDRVRQHRQKHKGKSVSPETPSRAGEKRGEETRREVSTKTKAKDLPPQSATGLNGGTQAAWPDELKDVQTYLTSVKLLDKFTADYWLKQEAWIKSTGFPIYPLTELKGYIANEAKKNGRQSHTNLMQGFRNWLSNAVRWKERDETRAQANRQHGPQDAYGDRRR